MLRLSSVLLVLAGIFLSISVHAQDTSKIIITTPAPSAACTKVDAHWEGEVWVTEHDVCKYENRPEGAAWIAEYWSCTGATAEGKCNAWTLVPGHWVATLP
jgi:hypothetical protein